MQRAEELFAWMAPSRAPELDVPRLSRALESLGGLHGLLNASLNARRCAGISPAAREFLSCLAKSPSCAEGAWAETANHHLVPFTDPRYPASLGVLEQRPVALHVVGNAEIPNEPQPSIVGSRNPKPASRDIAFEFAEPWARAGLRTTSGLTEGIDSAAHGCAGGARNHHRGARVRPRHHRSQRQPHCKRANQFPGRPDQRIPAGHAVSAQNFPQRNRIIAAMSLETPVVEAARRSGSLITARLPGDHNKVLFAVPGSIHNPSSRGCHELIRQGAKLTESVADVLSELNFSEFFRRLRTALQGLHTPPDLEAGMDKAHKILLDALGFDPADLDMLVVRTGFKPEAVSSMMLILELEGHVQAAPGGRYSRVVRSRR